MSSDAPSPTQEHKTHADILTAAADLLEKPGAWTQGCFARDQSGKPSAPRDPDAVCYCMAGAIYSIVGTNSRGDALIDVLSTRARRQGFRHIAHWNDKENRTQAEVVSALRAAADLARTEQVKG